MSANQRKNRPVLGYWIPLVATVSVATIGLVTWALHAHSSADDDGDAYDSDSSVSSSSSEHHKKPSKHTPQSPSGPAPFGIDGAGRPPYPVDPADGPNWTDSDTPYPAHPLGDHASTRDHNRDQHHQPDMFANFGRSTPFQAVKDVGRIVSQAFSSVASDTNVWLSEMQDDHPKTGPGSGPAVPASRDVAYPAMAEADKLVAVVVADTTGSDILSRIPAVGHNIRLVVLIHAPDGLPDPSSPSSLSSYTAVSMPDHSNPPSASRSRSGSSHSRHHHPSSSTDHLFTTANTLVSDPSCVIPFSTPDGWVAVVSHLQPAFVYVPAHLGIDVEPTGQSRARKVLPFVGAEVLVRRSGEDSYPADVTPDGRKLALIEESSVAEDWARRVNRL